MTSFNSMDDLNISAWNGPFGTTSNSVFGSTQNNRETTSFMINTASTTNQRDAHIPPPVEGVNQGVRETGIIEKLLVKLLFH